ncbi:response regulator [Algoriphagus resistens]|uniref:response regulator n=1 Tax=Algoriphagus resistens TaxID=1750590 RepID=UPI000716B43B|nr:response regulator [Algoriphagus resistens]
MHIGPFDSIFNNGKGTRRGVNQTNDSAGGDRIMDTEIILVDDDPVSLLLSRFLLEKLFASEKKIKLTSFKYPQEGLAHIERLIQDDKTRGSTLKVLLDINMPQINGFEFLERLNTYDPEKRIRVIMHSSSIDQDDISMSLTEPRVDCYISKPLEITKAKQVVDCFYNFSPTNTPRTITKR